MSKLDLKSTQKNILHLIITVLSFLCLGTVSAQSEKNISYGQKLNLTGVETDTKFHISGISGKTTITGNAINDYVFAKPGKYQIRITESTSHQAGNCAHKHLPNTITVNVGRIRMAFDREELVFSQPIRKNQDTKGIILKVAVMVETFDHKPAKISLKPVQTAGIGTSIVARPNTESIEMPEGKQWLSYSLSGIVTQNARLMFDFTDVNNNTQSIALPTPVKD